MPLSPVQNGTRPDGHGRETTLRVSINHPMRSWVEALQRVLEPRSEIEVLAGHTDVRWARQSVASGKVDVLLTHVQPPASEMGALLADLQNGSPQLKIVAISDAEDPVLVATALRCGVRGWVQPNASVLHLVRVMLGVMEGETWVPPRLLGPALDVLIESESGRQQAADLLSVLSPREVEMLQCLVMGLTRREIAERYTLSPHTVRTHINNVLHKLDVHSTLAAVSLARRTGLTGSLPLQRNG
jgi:DNA-binding NarL/FixJ family response regulator